MVKRYFLLGLSLIVCIVALDYLFRVKFASPYFGNDARYPVVFAYTYEEEAIDVRPLISEALSKIDAGDNFWDMKRNVIIIEGPNYWLVSISPLGNGNLEKSHYLAHDVYIMDGEFDIYLEKLPTTERLPIEKKKLHKTLIHPDYLL